MVFLSFFIVPLMIAIAGYIFFGRKISPKELAVQILIEAVVVAMICGAIYHSNTADTETWNGRVSSKTRDMVSCRHAYPCHCHSVSCGKNCTTFHCDVCYEHPFDVDWNVHTTNGETVGISRIDSQGLGQPPRWSSTGIGEPTSLPHSYTNYIKAAPDTIFRGQGEIKEQMPSYPNRYYDYYRLDHLAQFGVSVPDAPAWNKSIAELNGDLGHKMQANLVVMLAKGKGREWYKTLERSWVGGKKNDIVLVIGLNADDTIAWSEVMAWTDYAYFKVRLRDDVMAIGKLDRNAIIAAANEDVAKYFKRKPMSDFSYLAASVTPSRTEYVVGMVIAILVAIGLTWVFEEVDAFDDEDQEEEALEGFFGRLLRRRPKPQVVKKSRY